MLFLLRNIRRKLMGNNKIATYLLYAIGEIVLVVVGILIAVSIDDWQKEKTLRIHERQYLIEIKTNLDDDIGLCQHIQEYNQTKQKAIAEIFQLFATEKDENILPHFIPHLDVLFSFRQRSQSRVAFDNMANAQSIGIIKDNTLRAKLSSYYSKSFVAEERTKQFTRKLNDQLTPLLMNEQLTKALFGVALPVEHVTDQVPFYRNAEVIATLTNTVKNIGFQSVFAKTQEEEAKELIELIDHYLEE